MKPLNKFEVLGCPVADGRPACDPRCGGGWPGTQVTTEKLTAAIEAGLIDPDKLGCQPLEDRAKAGLREVLFFQKKPILVEVVDTVI